jgi:hypothetical protein
MSANLPPYLLDSQYVVSHNTLQQFTLPVRTDGSALHRPFSATRIAGGRNTCSIENLIERLRKNMIENLDDWNETKNDSDSTFRADQMTWEVTSIQQVPHDSSLLAFDAKGSFPYTFLAGQNSKRNTMTFGGPEDLQGHFIIGVGELTDISGAKTPRPRYLSPNTISIQSLSTIGAKSSSHTPREPKMATFSDQMRITTVMNQRPTLNSSLRHACQETTS